MKSPETRERTMILSSGRCAWAKCMYCGYGKLNEPRLGAPELKEQIDNFFNGVAKGTQVLRVYVSGNVTDRTQVPVESQKYMVQKCKEYGIQTLLVETLPQFVSEKTLEPYEGSGLNMIFAIGLECYDDELRKKLQKGFSRQDFERACNLIRSHKWVGKVSLLVNPPFADDPKKCTDDSVKYALGWADEITLINCQPHKDTELHRMWTAGEWRPLEKGEFFDVVKDWIANPKVRYDATQYAPFPSWKSWLPQFAEPTPIIGVGERELVNPIYEKWQKFVCERYKRPETRNVALFVPCSFTKPYANGMLHRAIRRTLDEVPNKDRVHLVVISSPGVIPIELSYYYPFDSYDWQPWLETPEIKKRYTDVTRERVKAYLKTHSYDAVFCYFLYDAESYEALNGACEELSIGLIQCLKQETWDRVHEQKNALSAPEALADLKQTLSGSASLARS